jgi:DNA-binding LytR/AlgR family response regulator
MVGIRKVAYALAARTYDFGNIPTEFVYEWRKDFLTYFFIVAVLYAYRWFQVARLGEANAPASRADAIEVRWNGRRFKIGSPEIEWIEAAGNYVIVHTPSGEHMVRATLKSMLDRLPDNFVRVHRSAAINLEMLAELNAREKSAKLKSGASAPVAQSYWSTLAQRFSNRNESLDRP